MVDVRSLLNQLNSDDVETYLNARLQLTNLGSVIIPSLIEVMLHDNGRESWRSATVLAGMAGIDDAELIPAFIKVLKFPHPLMRQIAVQFLSDYGGKAIVPYLKQHLYDPNTTVQLWAVEGLGRLGEQSIIPTLIILLKQSTSTMLQQSIINTLGRLQAYSAIPVIAQYLNAEDRHVRVRANEVYTELTQAKMED